MDYKHNVDTKVKKEFWILLAIVIFAFALRLFHLGTQSLWYDEGYSVYLAGKGLAQITLETASDIQPPLYYYLLHFWMLLFGRSEVAVRGLSVLFGVLSVPLFYGLGARLFSRPVGLLAAVLAALSPLYLWYSQEVRMYTLLVVLTLASCYLLWLALQETDPTSRRWKWAAVAFTMILALYTHYFAAFIFAFQIVYVLLGWRLGWRKLDLKEGALVVLATVLAYAPWLPALFGRYETDVSYWEGRLKLDEALRKIGISFVAGESVLEGTGQWLAFGFVLVILICLLAIILFYKRDSVRKPPASLRDSRWPPLAFLLLYLLLPVALLLLITYWSPKFNPRYAMIASPPFLILISAGLVFLFRIQQIWSRALALVMLLFVMGTMAYADFNAFFDIRFTKPDFRGAIQWIEDHQLDNEAVILTSGHAYPAFDYYYSGDNWRPLPEGRTLSTRDVLSYDVAEDLNRFLEGKRGVWLVLWQDEVVDPNGYLTMLLDQYAVPQPVEGSFYHIRLRRYLLPAGVHFPTVPDIAHPMAANLGNELTLLGYNSVMTDTLYQYWEARQPLEKDYKISLRLKDQEGRDWSCSDRDCRLAASLYPTTRWQPGEVVIGRYEILALPGAPPGVYDLEAIVYAEGAPQALDVLDEQGSPKGKTVRLGPVALDETWPGSKEDFGVTGSPLFVWGDQIALLGYEQDRLDAQAGDEVHLTLFWEVLNSIPVNYDLHLAWAQNDKKIAVQSYAPAGEEYPTSAWRAGDLLRGQYTLAVPLDIEPGAAEIELGLFDRSAASASFTEWFPLTSLNIEQTNRVFETPPVQIVLDTNFENKLSLIGVNLSSTGVTPDSTFEVTLYWKGLERMDTSYTVFVHLLDEHNQMQAQEDRIPAAGSRPTTGWIPGEVIEDTYQLVVSPEAKPGEYILEVGVYNANDPAFPRLSVIENGEPGDTRVIVAYMILE